MGTPSAANPFGKLNGDAVKFFASVPSLHPPSGSWEYQNGSTWYALTYTGDSVIISNTNRMRTSAYASRM